MKKNKNKYLMQLLSLANDPLQRNSIVLMASTAVMAVVGFFFWIIAAHKYSASSIGLASSLFSISLLLVSFGSLGLQSTLVRFLGSSKKPAEKINTSLTLTLISSLLVSVIFWFISAVFFPQLHNLLLSPIVFAIFFGSVLIGLWQQVLDSVFIAFCESHWVLIENIFYSFSKVLFLIIFVAYGASGIFASNFGAIAIELSIAFVFLIYKFKIFPKLIIDKEVFDNFWRYTTGSYLIQIVATFPSLILPAVITQSLSPEKAAYFFLAQTMVNLLLIIPQASNQTLFAEASKGQQRYRVLTIKSIKTQLALVLIPLIIIWFAGGWVLSFFGPKYVAEVLPLLKILSLGVFPVMLSYPLSTRLRIKNKVTELFYLTLAGTIVILLSTFLGSKFGIAGISAGYVFGQVMIFLILLIVFFFERKSKKEL